MFRNALTREVVVGAPDRVEQCRYAAILTRDEGELRNELTAGWKVIEVNAELSPYTFGLRH
jgi:mitochondrial import inner membrane translocase subunit TIM44